jgi:hypothetical protein
MGATYQVYEATRSAPISIYVMFSGMLAFWLWFVSPLPASSWPLPEGLVLFIALLTIGTAIGVIGAVRLIVSTTPRTRVYLFDSGLVRTNGDHRARAFFWNDISVRWYEGSDDENYYSCNCIVWRPGGGKVEMHAPSGYWRVSDVVEVGREVSRRVAVAQVPQVLAAVGNGRTVRFGRLAVNAGGLQVGQRRIPWDQVLNVTYSQGEVVVQTVHRSRGSRRRRAKAVPNASVLAAVADRLRSAP